MARPGYKALLIGNSTFPLDSSNLPTLEGPVNDVVQLREALTDDESGLFAADAVRVVPERTTSEVLFELERFFTSSRRDDCLLVYYSGHGMLNETNQLFLCARDSRTDYLRSTAISNSQVNLLVEAAPARTTVIVLDCCYSGAFKGGQGAATLAGTGRYILSSSRAAELANDTSRLNGTSLFTSHLVEALREAEDHDSDGLVDLDDVYEFVHAKLTAEGRQIPQRIFAGGGEVPIAARRTAAAAPAALPTPAPAVAGELVLSETNIHIPAVTVGDDLPPERVEVLAIGGGALDWKAETDAGWIAIEREPRAFVLRFTPVVGVNRGRVTVTDASGRQAVVRVTVEVRAPFLPLAPLTAFGPAALDTAATADAAAPAAEPATKAAVSVPEAEPGLRTGLARPPDGARYLPDAPTDSWDKWTKRVGAAVVPVVLLVIAVTWLINAINGGPELVFADGQLTLRSGQGFLPTDTQTVASTDLDRTDFYFVNDAALGGARFWADRTDQEGLVDLGAWEKEKLPDRSPPKDGYQRGGIPAVKDHLYIALADGENNILFRVLDVSANGVLISYIYR